MAKKIILPALRINDILNDKIKLAIKKYNENPRLLNKITELEFRRIALEMLSEKIILGN